MGARFEIAISDDERPAQLGRAVGVV